MVLAPVVHRVCAAFCGRLLQERLRSMDWSDFLLAAAPPPAHGSDLSLAAPQPSVAKSSAKTSAKSTADASV